MSTISSEEKRTMISITQLHSCQGTSKYIYIRQPFIISTGGGQEWREIGGGETVGIISLGMVLSLLETLYWQLCKWKSQTRPTFAVCDWS